MDGCLLFWSLSKKNLIYWWKMSSAAVASFLDSLIAVGVWAVKYMNELWSDVACLEFYSFSPLHRGPFFTTGFPCSNVEACPFSAVLLSQGHGENLHGCVCALPAAWSLRAVEAGQRHDDTGPPEAHRAHQPSAGELEGASCHLPGKRPAKVQIIKFLSGCLTIEI